MNVVHLIGYVGEKPKFATTQNGKSVVNFSLATTERYGSGENRKEDTQWHRVVAWNKQADVIDQYVDKGSRLYVGGKITHRKYEDRDGRTQHITEVVLSGFEFLNNKKPDQQSDRGQSQGDTFDSGVDDDSQHPPRDGASSVPEPDAFVPEDDLPF